MRTGSVGSDSYLAICTCALGMDNTLWDTLAVEVGKEVDQVEVLEKERSVSDPLIFLLAFNGGAIGRGVNGEVIVLIGGGGLVVGDHYEGLCCWFLLCYASIKFLD